MSKTKFEEIDNEQLKEMIENGVAVFDIRRKGEFLATGIIEGSIALTFFDDTGAHDIPAWMNEFEKTVKNKNQVIVLVCAHANRTKSIGKFLCNDMEYTEVYDLKGGISSWIQKGNETIDFK